MDSIIGLSIRHKDGAPGLIVDHVKNKPGYYVVRFEDGITVAQPESNLFIGAHPLCAVLRDASLLQENAKSKEVSVGMRSTTDKKIIESLKNSTPITLITGEAGTGKSTLVEKLRAELAGNTAVVAFTGVAARHIKGETIHSFFGFPITVLSSKTLGDPRVREKISQLSYLVIDEVSMLRADVLDAICNTLTEYGPQKKRPLGGIKLVLVGDFMQLDPVLESDDEARRYFYSKYFSSYFFEAHIFKETDVAFYVLTNKFRQGNDPEFGEVLSRMRVGQTTASDINVINQSVYSNEKLSLINEATWLTNTNERVDAINQKKLETLAGTMRCFHANVTGDFPPQSYPTSTELTLKKNARVMFVRNDTDKNRRWYNGSVATVTELHDHSIELRIHETGSILSVQRSSWDSYKYFYDREKDRLECVSVGKFEQFPLSLAWSTTIHKAQGKTLSSIYLDLPTDYRVMPSQLYVALSRAKSLRSVVISRQVTLDDVQVNKRALQAWNAVTANDGNIGKLELPYKGDAPTESPNGSPSSENNITKCVDKAIVNNDRLFMDYISKTGRKWRVVEPLNWLQHGVLFEAYCEENEENRSFRVDRIHEVRNL